jgi:hypothetical protein
MPSSTAANSARALRDRWPVRLAALLVVLLAAFLVSRSCGSSGVEISQERAIAIAKRQLDFEPECVQVRVFRGGLRSQAFWAVSLWTLDRQGRFERVAVVQINATTGEVTSVNEQPRLAVTQPQCASPV